MFESFLKKTFLNLVTLSIITVPLVAVWGLFEIFPTLVAIGLAPVSFIVSYILVSGIPARLSIRKIKRGRFKRTFRDHIYFGRMIYGKCWTMIFYFRPLYQVILSTPILKWMTFRLFGYQGSLDMTTYADTWIRDLPLLDLGEGVYLSNRATIGTNIVQKTGHILVDRIKIGSGSVIGHLAVIGPGAQIGESSEIGVNCTIGIRVKIGNNVLIKPTSTVYHASIVEDDVVIEPWVYVGVHCIIRRGIKVPSGTVIPDGTTINIQSDLEKLKVLDKILTQRSIVDSNSGEKDKIFGENINVIKSRTPRATSPVDTTQHNSF